ncbi:MAG: cellulase family glycosylhydrolase [Corynebacterium sp.]|nr:cellulase family glycosylhydrolase [Corynebacterium sp.]
MALRRLPACIGFLLSVLMLLNAAFVPVQANVETKDSPSEAVPIAANAPSKITQAGQWLVDEQGRVFLTQGVNMVYKHPPYTAQAAGFNADDAEWLQAQGFDSVRLGIIWKAVEPEPGVYDDVYLAQIAETVTMLADHGIATLIDAHQDMYHEKFQGEFAPDWAVIDDGYPSFLQIGFPTNQVVNVGLLRAYDNFLNNRMGPGGVGLQDRFAAMWQHVVTQLGGLPSIMGYDIINEPWPGSDFPICYATLGHCDDAIAKLDSLHQKAADAITAVDPTATIYFEPYSVWNAGIAINPQAPKVPETAGTVLSWHVYCATNALIGKYTGCDLPDGQAFANAQAISDSQQIPSLLSEFGATDDTDTLLGVTNLARANRIGWQYWSYCGCDDPTTQNQREQGIVADPQVPGAVTADAVNAEKLAVLAPPHMRLIAGTPELTHWDHNAKQYQARWTTTRADETGVFTAGESVLYVPSANFPHGFDIHVTGGSYTIAPDGHTVYIAADKEASEVAVEVVPA